MYVMRDTQHGHKGEEPWTKRGGSRLAERRFMLMGFAHRPAPSMTSPAIYKQPNRDGLVAYAQAMLYNANEQTLVAPGGYQPQVGWDTLNWKYPVDQSGAYEFDHGSASAGSLWPPPLPFVGQGSAPNPVIMLNWQAKLVPVTRLREATGSGNLPAKIQRVLGRTTDDPLLINH